MACDNDTLHTVNHMLDMDNGTSGVRGSVPYRTKPLWNDLRQDSGDNRDYHRAHESPTAADNIEVNISVPGGLK